MIPSKILTGLVVLALIGCRDKPQEMAKVSEVFPNLPLPPAASLVSREGSADALKLTLMAKARPAMVEAYYRDALSSRNGWRLVGDTRDAEGALVLLAQQNGPSLWVRIQSTDDSVMTKVELAGALVSGTRTNKPAS
ncbi:MAG TPA: hypothetical protein VFR62_11110 [Gemmatimonadales bacterium]|nr:hypothetical protein [Gemmatimonadales bacterium]